MMAYILYLIVRAFTVIIVNGTSVHTRNLCHPFRVEGVPRALIIALSIIVGFNYRIEINDRS